MATLPVVKPPAPMAELPVLSGHKSEKSESKSPSPLVHQQAHALHVDAIPVRLAPESRRLDVPSERRSQAATTVLPTPDGDFWHTLVLEMVQAETVGALVRELALQSQLVARDDSGQPSHWMLRVENASLNQPNARDRLQLALEQHGHIAKLSVEVGTVTDSPSRRLTAASALQQQQAEQAVMQDPFVQHLMQNFGGRIVPGTLKPLAS